MIGTKELESYSEAPLDLLFARFLPPSCFKSFLSCYVFLQSSCSTEDAAKSLATARVGRHTRLHSKGVATRGSY
jgi:hypothetical protein